MTRMDNNISSSVKKYILYSAAALTMIAATVFILYQQVSKNIINTNIATMNEVALHDSMAVESVINERWSLLEALGNDLRHERFTTTKEVLAELRQGRHFVNAKMLVLVDDKGTVYRSTGLIGDKDDAKIAQELGNEEKRIVKRYDYVSPNYVQFNQEYLLVGVKLKPFTVEGTTYTHLAALIRVRDIEKNLSVQSYQGEGVGYVIDSNGYYVVNIYRSHNFMTRENFFDDIKGRSFSNYGSVEEIKAELAKGTKSFATTMKKDNDRIVVFRNMDIPDWYFVSVAPKAVFDEQTNQLVAIFGIVCGILLLVVLAFIIWLFRTQKTAADSKLRLEQKHKAELSEALVLAEKANRSKTVFLNNMSHDIRTPMNAIMGFTDLAAKHIENKQAVQGYLAKIAKSSQHLLSLINDVLEMSRIESGAVTIHEAKENLAELINSLRDMLQADIKAKQMHFVVDMSEVQHEYIICDKLRLDQVLINLTSNALKYTEAGGTISLRIVEKQGKEAGRAAYEFRVRDNGIGMSEEFVKTIFEPFTREQTSTVSGIQGTGLGMSIAKNIVEIMGGTISVTSEEHKGSEFIVTLEFKLAEPDAKPAGQAGQSAAQKFDFAGKKVLLVEDNELNREIATVILSDVGFVITPAVNGKEAYENVLNGEAAAYDVVLMDIQMPVMDGYAATKAIRGIPDMAKAKVPIIAMTANAFMEDKMAAMAAGMNGHIAKPISLPKLYDELNRVLHK